MKSPALERIALVCLLAPSLGGCAQLTQLTGGGTSVVVDDAQGISLGSQVRVHGVSVGRVTEVSLEAEGARIGIELPSDVALQSDACATVRAQGMVGEVYLHIDPGHAETGWEGSVLTACDRPSLEDASTESLTELAGLVRDLRSYVAQLESGERALCAITTAAPAAAATTVVAPAEPAALAPVDGAALPDAAPAAQPAPDTAPAPAPRAPRAGAVEEAEPAAPKS